VTAGAVALAGCSAFGCDGIDEQRLTLGPVSESTATDGLVVPAAELSTPAREAVERAAAAEDRTYRECVGEANRVSELATDIRERQPEEPTGDVYLRYGDTYYGMLLNLGDADYVESLPDTPTATRTGG